MKKLMTLLLVVCLAFVSCQSNTPANTNEATGESEVVSQHATVTLNGITNTLDVNVANFTNTSTIMNHIMSNLIDFDENFAMVPDALLSWDQTDPKTFELKINTEYKFHNGDPLTVEDVQFSILRLRDIPQSASLVQNIESVNVVNEDTLELKTVESKNNTLRKIATTVVVNKALLEEQGDEYWKAPVGSGPFEFVSFTPGQQVEVKRWEDYPLEKPVLESITFKSIEDATSLYIALETGETDFISKVQYLDQKRAMENPDINIESVATVSTGFISMNTTVAPFDNEAFRRAIAHATDKESMALLAGTGVAIDSMVPSFIEGYYSSDKMPTYDLEKAKALLKEAGVEEGYTFKCSSYTSDTSNIELLQADLKKIGLNMEIEILEFGVFLDKVMSSNYELLFGSWGNTNGDVSTMLNCYTEASIREDNLSFYVDPEIDRLKKLADETVDPQEKLDALMKIQDIAAQAMPIIPTITSSTTFGKNARLKNVKMYPTGNVDFTNAYFE